MDKTPIALKEYSEPVTELQNINGAMVILFATLIPTLHSNVTTNELKVVHWLFLLIFSLQVGGTFYFYKNKMINSFKFVLWRGLLTFSMIILGQSVAYFLINDQLTTTVSYAMVLPIFILIVFSLCKNSISGDTSYRNALKCGRIKVGEWDCNYKRKYEVTKEINDYSSTTSSKIKKISVYIIGIGAALGSTFSGTSIDVYLLYIVELMICGGMAWIFTSSYWLDLIYTFRAGLSKIKEFDGT